jgi:hypothetical protein
MGTDAREVSEHELLVRINRKLQPRGQVMRHCARDAPNWASMGDYHLIEVNTNVLQQDHCDLAQWGYELGVLADGEVLAASD